MKNSRECTKKDALEKTSISFTIFKTILCVKSVLVESLNKLHLYQVIIIETKIISSDYHRD